MTDYETMVEASWKLLPLKQQHWLHDAMKILRHDFWQIGEEFPDVITIIVDYPGRDIGVRWMGMYQQSQQFSIERSDLSNLTDYYIFINPTVTGLTALNILSHELVHASVGVREGHGEPFLRVAAAIGLDDSGPTALAEETLLGRLKGIQKTLGPYPLITDCLEAA